VTTLTAPAAMKALRQPHTSPIHAPTGAAQTVAMDTPVRISDIARAKSARAPGACASAADIDQKPPSATPSITRATSSTGRLLAVAASTLDSSSNAGEGQHHALAVQLARQQRQRRRGDGADQGRGGDGLAGRAVADAEVGGHGGEQAGGQELGRDQAEDAQRERGHGGPVRGGGGGRRRQDVGARRRHSEQEEDNTRPLLGNGRASLGLAFRRLNAGRAEMLDHSSSIASLPNATIREPDLLTQILLGLRLDGVEYGRCVMRAPWAVAFPAQRSARFHFVGSGGCWLRTAHGLGATEARRRGAAAARQLPRAGQRARRAGGGHRFAVARGRSDNIYLVGGPPGSDSTLKAHPPT
jgi:hypothetical protein